MKKRQFAAMLLAALLVLSLTACGGANKALVGAWQLTDGEETEYGWGLKFNKDGTMSYATGGDAKSQEEMDEAFKSLQALYKIKYKIKSDSKMEITMSAFMGMAKESTDVEYRLDGDTLVFDGATYTRIKK